MATTDYAKWFLHKNPNLYYGYLDENLKLNKLLYFSDLMYYAVNDDVLFEERFERWDKGPVAPSVHRAYRYEGLDRPNNNEISIDNEEKIKVMNIVNLVFGDWDADRLSIETHDHNTWKEMKRNEKYSYENTNPSILSFLKNLYLVYKDIEFDSFSKEVINGNVFIYDLNNVELTDEKLEELAGYEGIDSPVFVEEIDGELVLL